ncbi:MAG: hypothetical protein GF329_14690 [Candidatus Lokiarchaeota archaeon]|nr:hypothetical protein [Candidatus Lokiarchaeota archaeon]
MTSKKKKFTCTICKSEFPKRQIGRVKLLRRKKKGESISWICAKCAKTKIKIISE